MHHKGEKSYKSPEHKKEKKTIIMTNINLLLNWIQSKLNTHSEPILLQKFRSGERGKP